MNEIVYNGQPPFTLDAWGVSCGTRKIKLSRRRRCVLKTLLAQMGQVVPYDDLIAAAWFPDQVATVDRRALFVTIRHVRVALDYVKAPVAIQNTLTIGYRLVTQ